VGAWQASLEAFPQALLLGPHVCCMESGSSAVVSNATSDMLRCPTLPQTGLKSNVKKKVSKTLDRFSSKDWGTKPSVNILKLPSCPVGKRITDVGLH
jgi:hypothetical protein